MSFRSDIQSTEGLHDAWQPGTQALEQADRDRLDIARPRTLCGSVAIDERLRRLYPSESRWDYAVCKTTVKMETVHFIEVHPASTVAHLREVREKADWLLTWLQGTPLKNAYKVLHWVPTGRVSFTQRDPKLKALAAKA